MNINQKRVRCLNDRPDKSGPVAYWMSRDQRIHDNWALLYAQKLAMEQEVPLLIVFCLVPEFLGATFRQYEFMLGGLQDAAAAAKMYAIPFCLRIGKPEKEIPEFVAAHDCSVLVTDFDPLRIKRLWKDDISNTIPIPFYEVDAHNIVPCWNASGKQEYAAYTIRKKIHAHLAEYLDVFPDMQPHTYPYQKSLAAPDFLKARRHIPINIGTPAIEWLKPGEQSAHEALTCFIDNNLAQYNQLSNDPNAPVLSNLSPYIHFGQLSAQRAALEVSKYSEETGTNAEGFLEQLIVRRELAENYCYYCKDYDTLEGIPDWARRTLDEHRDDPREYLYGSEEFESARTHDTLWNAAQLEMLIRGKMHSYLRMYWAKKILEWSPDPETALHTAIRLNDTYELDGRDPNGYTGIIWSIGGLHDRAWSERQVFGKIRYMSYGGCRRKFDVPAYIGKIDRLKQKYR